MGTYTVQPNDNVEIYNERNTIKFPPNDDTKPITYTVTYTDDSDCTNSTTVTVLHDLCKDYMFRFGHSLNNVNNQTFEVCPSSPNKINYQYPICRRRVIQLSLWRKSNENLEVKFGQVTDNVRAITTDIQYGDPQTHKGKYLDVQQDGPVLTLTMGDVDDMFGIPAYEDTVTVTFGVQDERSVKDLQLSIEFKLFCPGYVHDASCNDYPIYDDVSGGISTF